MGLYKEADILDAVIEKTAAALSLKEKPFLAKIAKIMLVIEKIKPGATIRETELVFPLSKLPVKGMTRQHALETVKKEMDTFGAFLTSNLQKKYRGTAYEMSYGDFLADVQDLTKMIDVTFTSKSERQNIREALNAIDRVRNMLKRLAMLARTEAYKGSSFEQGVQVLHALERAILGNDEEARIDNIKALQRLFPEEGRPEDTAIVDVARKQKEIPAVGITAVRDLFQEEMDEFGVDEDLVTTREDLIGKINRLTEEVKTSDHLLQYLYTLRDRWDEFKSAVAQDIPLGAHEQYKERLHTPTPQPPAEVPQQVSQEEGEEGEWGEWGPPQQASATKLRQLTAAGSKKLKLDRPSMLPPRERWQQYENPWRRAEFIGRDIDLFVDYLNTWEASGRALPFVTHMYGRPDRGEAYVRDKNIIEERLTKETGMAERKHEKRRSEKERYEEMKRPLDQAYEAGERRALWSMWRREYIVKLLQVVQHALAPELRSDIATEQAFDKVLREFHRLLNYRLSSQ